LGCIEWLNLEPGDTLLIIGATGGVGSYAIQIAKARGCHVTATAAAADADYARDLGAGDVIDFQARDTVDSARELAPDGFDGIVDLVNGPDQLNRVAGLVRENGRVLSTLFAADIDALARQGVVANNFLNHPLPHHFTQLAKLVESGELRVHVQTFHLENAADALQLSELGQVRGKLALVM
jgi:NADPH:quinone reductase-like Zn-dependent oxidoreductase